MKFVHRIAVLTIIAIALSIHTQAQSLPDPGQLGVRANFTGQTSIEVPYMLNEDLSLAPYLGINAVKDQTTTVMFGVRPRYYTGLSNSVGTFFTGTLGITNTSFNNTPNSNSNTDFIIGVGYGAEYFFSEKFSVSADVNLNSRLGDSNNSISTAARVSASIYF